MNTSNTGMNTDVPNAEYLAKKTANAMAMIICSANFCFAVRPSFCFLMTFL